MPKFFSTTLECDHTFIDSIRREAFPKTNPLEKSLKPLPEAAAPVSRLPSQNTLVGVASGKSDSAHEQRGSTTPYCCSAAFRRIL